MTLLLVAILSAISISRIHSLSCIPCPLSPCEYPQCCKSGFTTGDLCGCCQTCAKGLGDSCGGPWNSEGRCGLGLSCMRTCRCDTVENKPCVFPFNFKGRRYYECTTEHSENGLAWCATEVNKQGNVAVNKWQDCKPGCPGFIQPLLPTPPEHAEAQQDGEILAAPPVVVVQNCVQTDLFNFPGRCITNEDREFYEARDDLVLQFDDGEKNASRTIQTCPAEGKGTTCQCTKSIPQGQLGHCLMVPGFNPNLEQGWCWLDHIGDPEDLAKDCFEDAQWSKSNGRFWSNLACE